MRQVSFGVSLRGWLRNLLQPPVFVDGSEVILSRRRIYIVPTRVGVWFCIILFVMLLGSMNYSNSMGYMLTFLLGSLLLVVMLHTHRNLMRLRVCAGRAQSGFVGESVVFEVWLENQGFAGRYALQWQRCPLVENELQVVDVSPNVREVVVFSVPALQRGYLSLGGVRVATEFPLGLFYAWSYVYLDLQAVVYPQPLGRRELPLGGDLHSGEGSLQRGGGEDFIGYRDYQTGDSPRHVDWKAVARERGWLVKQFGGLGMSRVWLRWGDVQDRGSVEAALSQLCLWVLVADGYGVEYGLALPSVTFEPSGGEAHRVRCLRALALYGLD